jgi:hypothetical protein
MIMLEPHQRHRCRQEDNIKMDLHGIGCGGGGIQWIDLTYYRGRSWALVNVVINLWVL